MRNILTLMAVFVGAHVACGQSLDVFKEQLAAPAVSDAYTTAQVTVEEHDQAALAVSRGAKGTSRLRVKGYRVCIFFDNGQSGQDPRAGAVAAKSLFESTFPGIKVHMVYQTPYFKVSVGNCLTVEEAIILKGRISSVFPKAFAKNEELSLADLVE